MEQKGPSPYTQQPAPVGYPDPNEPIPKVPFYLFQNQFNII